IGKINFFPAEVTGTGSQGVGLRLAGGNPVTVTRQHALSDGERVSYGVPGEAVVAVRPEHHSLQPLDQEAVGPGATGSPGVPGRVRRALFLGNMTRYFVTCEGALKEVVVESPRPVP